jgi:hypothetical protein
LMASQIVMTSRLFTSIWVRSVHRENEEVHSISRGVW